MLQIGVCYKSFVQPACRVKPNLSAAATIARILHKAKVFFGTVTGQAASAAPVKPKAYFSSLGDHHIRYLYQNIGLVAGLEAEVVDRLGGDRRGDDDASAMSMRTCAVV
jgi:hypothetical protein